MAYTCTACRGVARPADIVDDFLHGFLLDAARGEADLLAGALAVDDTPEANKAEVLARLSVLQGELSKDPAVVVAECGLTFATYASVRRGLEAEEQTLLASLIPAGHNGRVLPPAGELEAMVADPDSLTQVHDLLTNYLDTYGLEIVLNRVGRGSHNQRNRPGITAEERLALSGIEVRRVATPEAGTTAAA